MAVCTTVTEWIQTEITTPMEVWEEEQEKKCKKRHWYDPRSWFCWFIYVLVKVVRWVVEYVLTPIFTVVCRLVADLLSIIGDLLQFLWLLLKALFTWDKCTLQEAIGELGNAVGGALILVGDVLIRPIVDRVQTHRLRGYVKDEIAQKYARQPEVISALNELFRVDHGVFGYRLTCKVYRMYVDSRTTTAAYADVPNLLGLHNDGKIDLYALAGFKDGCAIFSGDGWYRPRHQTAVYPFAAGGGGLGEPTPPELEKEHLDEYISAGGQGWRHFRIYASSQDNLDMRIDAAKEKGRQLGLILDFEQEDKEVIDPDFINYNRNPVNELKGVTEAQDFYAQGKDKCTEWNSDGTPWRKGQLDYLVCELGRTPKVDHRCCKVPEPFQDVTGSMDDALCELCEPVAVCVFGFIDRTTRGLASNLIGTTDCPPPKESGIISTTTPAPTPQNNVNLSPANASGVSFIDDIPDELRKYVFIHELGHYFGLCHVSGFDRIMVSGKEGQGYVFSILAVGNTLIHGGPRFIFTEAERVWNFVLSNFPLKCFIEEPEAPSGPTGPVIL
jgi:hypothetical protein